MIMHPTVTHWVRLARHAARPGRTKRSPRWPAVEKEHLRKFPQCAVCQSIDRLQVHHIRPFHLSPALELDPGNLVTLCMSKGNHCHLLVGHGDDFKAFVPGVKDLAFNVLAGKMQVGDAQILARMQRAYELD